MFESVLEKSDGIEGSGFRIRVTTAAARKPNATPWLRKAEFRTVNAGPEP